MARPVSLSVTPAERGQQVSASWHAVVDIGSNSVRLAVFDRIDRTPSVVFNEKVLCGLGRGLSASGRLDPDGIDRAVATLQRFTRLIEAMQISSLDVVATAAVREASDGAAFADTIERACGLRMRILSGSEEAEYSALGVVSGIADADGLIGDLGGGSLELVDVNNGTIGVRDTLPLGPLRFNSGTEKALVRANVQTIRTALDKVGWLGRISGKTLYAVGGSWRAIGRLHMAQTGHPVRVINRYSLEFSEIQKLSALVARQSVSSLERIEGLPRRRLESLPIAATVLREILTRSHPKKIMFCSYGLREGLVYARLSDNAKRVDPLIISCQRVVRQLSRFPDQGDAIARFLRPLFARESARFHALCRAASILSDVGWRQHPDYRAEQAFLEVLRMPTLAADHDERAFIALAIWHRYRPKKASEFCESVAQLVTPDRRDQARTLGLAIRLAQKLTAGVSGHLARFDLELGADELVLNFSRDDVGLMGVDVEHQLKQLAQAVGRTPKLHTD